MNLFNCGICGDTTPQLPSTLCEIVKRKGGIKNGLLFTCNFNWDSEVIKPKNGDSGTEDEIITIGSVNDLASWQTAIDNGLISVLPLSLITLGEPEALASVRINGCLDEEVTDFRSEVNVVSFISPSDLSDFDFWKKVKKNWRYYKFAYTDCDGNLFLNDEQNGFSIRGANLFYSLGEDNTQNASWNFNFGIENNETVKPIVIDGLNSIL